MEKKDLSNLAKQLRYYRKLREMTQDDLSAKTGINVSMIKKYESDFRNPKFEQIVKLADALNVTVFDLMDLDFSGAINPADYLKSLYNQKRISIAVDKDKAGNYIPDSVTVKFLDDTINESLISLLGDCKKEN